MIRDVELSILEAQPARSLDHRRVGTAGSLVGKAKDPRETVLFRVEGDFLDPHGRPATITVSTFEGEIFEVHHASLEPKLEYPLPILYGGPSRRAARIAACHADGWLAGTVPLTTVDARLSYMRELLDSIDHLFLSATPRTILDEDRERVRSRVDVERMSRDGKRNWVTPPGGAFRTIEDIRGVVVVGDAGDVAAGVLEYYYRGFDHFTFDVRNQFDRFEETLEAISGSVLPIVRTEIARADAQQADRRS